MSTPLEVNDIIRKQWNLFALFMDSLLSRHGRKLPESGLLSRELSAEVFRVKCYTVCSAQRAYQACEPGYSPEQETSVRPEDYEGLEVCYGIPKAGLPLQTAMSRMPIQIRPGAYSHESLPTV